MKYAMVAAVWMAMLGSLAFAQDESAETPKKMFVPHVVQIILNDENRQGIDWEAIVSQFHPLPLNQDGVKSEETSRVLSLGLVSDEDFSVLLDALEAVGQVKHTTLEPVIFKPDEIASFFLSPGQDSSIMSYQIKARLLANKSVPSSMEISPTLVIQKKDPGGLQQQTYSAMATMDLVEQQTMVIGSLLNTQEVIKTHKFPLLGDLPLIGLVFRHQGKWVQRIETVVFLAPSKNT